MKIIIESYLVNGEYQKKFFPEGKQYYCYDQDNDKFIGRGRTATESFDDFLCHDASAEDGVHEGYSGEEVEYVYEHIEEFIRDYN